MANEQNLIPAAHKLTVEEASKGGKASGEARRKKREIREMLEDDDRTAPKTIAPGGATVLHADDADAPERPSIVGTDGTNAAPANAANPFAKKKEKKPKRLIPETYTVEEGDTLMRISAKFYGTNHKWRAIREANKTIIFRRIRAQKKRRLDSSLHREVLGITCNILDISHARAIRTGIGRLVQILLSLKFPRFHDSLNK